MKTRVSSRPTANPARPGFPTRANTQPAFGAYTPVPETAIAGALGLFVLTIEGDRISAITWFADTSTLPRFGLPRTLR